MGINAKISGKIYKAVSHHRKKSRAKKKAKKLRKWYPNTSYRVTKSERHEESREEYGSGWVVWVAPTGPKKEKRKGPSIDIRKSFEKLGFR